jgi:hypothetical protein
MKIQTLYFHLLGMKMWSKILQLPIMSKRNKSALETDIKESFFNPIRSAFDSTITQIPVMTQIYVEVF